MSAFICPNCNYQTEKNELFCCKCGTELTYQKSFCKSCGTELKQDNVFCTQCGKRKENKKLAKVLFDYLKKSIVIIFLLLISFFIGGGIGHKYKQLDLNQKSTKEKIPDIDNRVKQIIRNEGYTSPSPYPLKKQQN